MAAQLPGPVGDSVDRDRDPLLAQTIPQGGVVVGGDGNVRILNQFFVSEQFAPNSRFGFKRQPALALSPVGDREVQGIGPICLQLIEEPRSTDAKELLDLLTG